MKLSYDLHHRHFLTIEVKNIVFSAKFSAVVHTKFCRLSLPSSWCYLTAGLK